MPELIGVRKDSRCGRDQLLAYLAAIGYNGGVLFAYENTFASDFDWHIAVGFHFVCANQQEHHSVRLAAGAGAVDQDFAGNFERGEFADGDEPAQSRSRRHD